MESHNEAPLSPAPVASTQAFAFQVVSYGEDRNGQSRYAVHLYRLADPYPTTNAYGERVGALQYIPALTVYGDADVRDDARRHLRASCRELPDMSGVPTRRAQRAGILGEPVVSHGDAFDLFREPPYVLLASAMNRAQRSSTNAIA